MVLLDIKYIFLYLIFFIFHKFFNSRLIFCQDSNRIKKIEPKSSIKNQYGAILYLVRETNAYNCKRDKTQLHIYYIIIFKK